MTSGLPPVSTPALMDYSTIAVLGEHMGRTLAASMRFDGDERPRTAPVPRFGLTREEAATSLGMSVDSFERHVQADLKLVRRGRHRIVPVVELERWVNANAEGLRRR